MQLCMMRKKTQKASVLAFVLIMISILLLASLSLTSALVTDRKTAMDSGKSLQALQETESGLESVISEIKKQEKTNGLEQEIRDVWSKCSSNVVRLDDGRKVYFRNDSGNQMQCDESLKNIASIVSYGQSGGASRAVETSIRKYAFFCGYHKVKDDNSNVYETVKLGESGNEDCWIKQNLNSGKPSDKYCPDGDYDNCNIKNYGALYTWEKADKACPDGFRLPTDEEWSRLEASLKKNASEECSENRVNTFECNDAGVELRGEKDSKPFKGGNFPLSGKYKYATGDYESPGLNGYYWTGSPNGSSKYWYRQINVSDSGINRYSIDKNDALSVRCVKDNYK